MSHGSWDDVDHVVLGTIQDIVSVGDLFRGGFCSLPDAEIVLMCINSPLYNNKSPPFNMTSI